jgi:hypothetical protein
MHKIILSHNGRSGAEDEICSVSRIVKELELMLPKKPVFKTGAVIRAWLPRLDIATVGNAF